MATSADYFISLLLLIGSGLFLAGITPYSPIYFFLLLAIIVFAFKQILKPEIKHNKLAYFNLFVFIFSFAAQSLIPNTKFPNTLGLILPYFFFFFCYQNLNSLSKNSFKNLIYYMLIFHTLLFIADAFWRLSHPTLYSTNMYSGHTREQGLAYMFKFNSIMYLDANFVGVQICLTYFFMVYLSKKNIIIPNAKIIKSLLFILTILSTSRSAIITLLLYSVIFNRISFPITINKKQIFGIISLAIILIFISLILLSILSRDASFNSKFILIDLAITLLKSASLNTILLGIGMGNTASFIGMGAHNLIITLLIETGLIGLLLFSINMYFLGKNTSWRSFYVVLPLITMGFSAASLAFPFFLVQLCIIYILEQQNEVVLQTHTDTLL
ncbi:MAG: hypothetical protein V4538_09205 [Bacteroidota bacterium]